MFWGTITKFEVLEDQYGNGSVGAFEARGTLHMADRRRPAHFEYVTVWTDNGCDGVKTSEFNLQDGWALDLLSAREFLAVRRHLFELCWAYDTGQWEDVELPGRLVFTVSDDEIAGIGRAA